MAETVPRDVQELLCRAEEACATAARMVSPEARLMLLALARCYQSLAECVARDAQLERMLRDISISGANCVAAKPK